MAEYQERPKQSSSNNNNNRAIEPERYGGSYPKYSQPSVEITPERLKEIEEFEDEHIFKRFCSPEVYNKYKKQEIETEQFFLSLENDVDGEPRERKRKQTRPKRKGIKFSKKYLQAKEKTLQQRLETLQRQLAEFESEELGQDIALFDERDKDLSKDKTDTATISVEKRDPAISEKKEVSDFTEAEKLGEALKLTGQKLPKALGEQLMALVSPTSLAIMVGVFGAYTASHAVGIGFIADAAMLVGGGVFLGWQAVDVAKDVWAFAQYVNATTDEELDKAADHLARAIMTVGFDVILGILTKRAAGKVSQHVDDLKQVDVAHAHSGGPTNTNAGNLNNANNTAGQIQPYAKRYTTRAQRPLGQANQIQPRTTSNVVVPSNLNGLSPTEFKRLSDVVTAKGLKLSSILNLYNDLGLKNVQDIVKQTDDEIAAAIRAIELERVDSGHSIKRHGPQIKDNVLEDRVTTGYAADGVFSPIQASTRFTNYETFVKSRDLALKEIEKLEGIDLSKPPAPGKKERYEFVIEFDKPIDDGFVGDPNSLNRIQHPKKPRKKAKVYTSTNAIKGVTRTKTTVSWNGNTWKVQQHTPWATDWDNTTKTYSKPADSFVKLP